MAMLISHLEYDLTIKKESMFMQVFCSITDDANGPKCPPLPFFHLKTK